MTKTRKKIGGLLMVATACVLAGTIGFSASVQSASAAVLEAKGKYYSDFDTYVDALKDLGATNKLTAEEGQVLLKNKDNVLPLDASSTKVSIFGNSAKTTVAGPSNSHYYKQAASAEDKVSDKGVIYDSLKKAGFNVNDTLADVYAKVSWSTGNCGTETTEFSDAVMTSIKEYSDVGVVVFSRYGGEGSDLDLIIDEEEDNMYGTKKSAFTHDAHYRGEFAAKSNDGGNSSGGGMGGASFDVSKTSKQYNASGKEYKHYLQLTEQEETLLELVKKNCDKVVVVLNTSNAMEIYDMKVDDDIDAILLMGRGGDNGHLAVGEILAGTVNPSGGLVDEWNTDFTADPTWNNYSWNAQNGTQNMYYRGVYGSEGQLYEYGGNGNFDDHLTRKTAEDKADLITYGSHNQNAYYGTDYEEDIYLGYAYWETLYNEIYQGLTTKDSVTYRGNGVDHTVTKKDGESAAQAADRWWSENVAYGFGHGLSYTTFSFNVKDDQITAKGGSLTKANETTVENFDITKDMTKANLTSSKGNAAKVKTLYIPVEVKNTGSVAGKQTVELYATAPYDATDAKLEKSFVNLVGFAKTDVIKPGETQTVTVEVNVQDMASFNYTGAYDMTGYTMEKGNWTLRAMSSSHYSYATDVANTNDDYDELTFTVDDHAELLLDDFSGNVCDAIFSDSYDDDEVKDKVNGNVWATDTDKDHYQVYNSLRTGNLMADGESGQVNVSRSTITSYFPKAPEPADLTYSASYVDHMDYWNQFSAADTESDNWYKDASIATQEGWKQNQGKVNEKTGTYDIVLSDMSGKKFRDEDGTLTAEWNEFMNQLTVDEMTTLIRKNQNMWRSTGLPNIGKAANQQKDSYNNNGDSLLWVDAPTITATWNTELAYHIGEIRGEVSLWHGWSAWGGPEMDTHRSPFSGRNYEYMSSEGLLGGYVAAGLTAGMESKGVTCYIKHFALNDQETCRDGMENMVWVSEQAARQIYFKVFQICMQEGGSSSSMTGFARFCGIPTSSNNRLMEGMVVNQWGWEGFFITDGYSGFSRCTTMATMCRSYVVPLPLKSAIPAISGRYDEETNKFYAYTGAWDAQATTYIDSEGNEQATGKTQMYTDRGTEDQMATGYYVGTEQESYTQWYYVRMLAARILYIESNALTNLNGHSTTTLPTLGTISAAKDSEFSLKLDLSGEAKSCFDENGKPNYDVVYKITKDELPDGLTLDEKTGVISGTPTKEGTYKFTVSVYIDKWVSYELVNDDNDSINPNLSKEYTIKVGTTYTQKEIDTLISDAVTSATSDMFTQEQVNQKVQEATSSATSGMFTQAELDQKIADAVANALAEANSSSSEGGCGSVIGIASAAVATVTVLGAAMIIRRKED